MDLEYDAKFEEMKKYIPFLENMIKRLESTSTASSNPRQAQLDKIRSLRDLLLDKKKRMKMENLLKCEQVLINLYAKVEQKDAQPGKSTSDETYSANSTKSENKDLDAVRNKLKAVTTKESADNKETLPEISRASEIEEVCTPGSKEPALFQRRPNKSSISPSRGTLMSPSKSTSGMSKRSYTRVLVSPEPDSRRRDAKEGTKKDSPLFSRRSPSRQSQQERYSSSHERKKDRKKGSKQERYKKTKGLNITLNVPEESLNSLNTEDILSRIMNCNDNDMDIETLREAKRQILSELSQTGANYDDISDLLLKSYKNKPRRKKRPEVEEGELSDSESEAIESIYGGLNSAQTASGSAKISDDKEQPRKIQICLVINSDDTKAAESAQTHEPVKKPLDTDASDFEMYAEKSKESDNKVDCKNTQDENKISEDSANKKQDTELKEVKEDTDIDLIETTNKPANFYKPLKEQKSEDSDKADDENRSTEKETSIKPTETEISNEKMSTLPQNTVNDSDKNVPQDSDNTKDRVDANEIEIPLLNDAVPTVEKPKDSVVSEIDILQALKNEILSESLSISGSEAATPALHQPKINKVVNAKEIAPKKRISIENYKNKKPLKNLFIREAVKAMNYCTKQSLKLTTKECERFNVPIKVALDDDNYSSDEGADKDMTVDDIYGGIAPKSPDHDVSSDVGSATPVIIPVDPVKTSEVLAAVKDVDMRTFPLLLPNVIPKPVPSPIRSSDASDSLSNEAKNLKDNPIQTNLDKPKLPTDPRMRREQSLNPESNPFSMLKKPERVPLLLTPPTLFPNRSVLPTGGIGPIMSPVINPSMTPNMTPSMTPNARTFEIEENTAPKHVYTPMFTPFDARESESSMTTDFNPYLNPTPNEQESRRNRWDPDVRDSNPRKWDDRDPRASSVQRDGMDYQRQHNKGGDYNHRKNTKYKLDRRESLSRQECPQAPGHPFGRSDCPPTPSNTFGVPSLLDCPMTPVHPFGRSDCPPTPIHPFGRNDCPTTPSHPFGRSDGPSTPIHPFGRSECPTTPIHPFGRSDCPTTPSHPFGRSDNLMTSHQPFGRNENVPRDPRLNRSADYDKFYKHDRERSNDFRDRPGYKSDFANKSIDGYDNYRDYRERGESRYDYRSDRYDKYSSRGRRGQFNRESMSRREPSVGRGGREVSKEVDSELFYSRNRNYGNQPDYYNENENSKGSYDYDYGPKWTNRKGFYRERSVGRSAHEERSYRSSSRARSVSKGVQNKKKLSVKQDLGRSFTIDTSVNSTFQNFLESKNIQVFDYSFDSRRQRAASVGRSLARESSVAKVSPPESNRPLESFKPTKRLNFQRASSMGRHIAGKEERSFKDIKADFELFKAQIQETQNNVESNFTKKEFAGDIRKSRKDSFDSTNADSSRKQYSPRKNIRDPRVRREFNEGSKFDDRHKRHEGIVYSSANITKGTILGSGYGVKNYKIPKIKRAEEPVPIEKVEPVMDTENITDVPKKVASPKIETEKKIGVKNKTSLKKDLEPKVVTEKVAPESNEGENLKSIKIQKQTEKVPEKKTKENKTAGKNKSFETESTMVDSVEKRVTRLSKKNQTATNVKAKPRKAVIYDSESEEENSKDSQKLEPDKKETDSKKRDDVSNTADENTFDSQSGDQMDSSFGIDDLFSDNIVSDPVIDNINELIADLDNELGPAKIVTPTDFSNDIIENMLESITDATGKEDTKSLNEDEKFNDISEVISNDLNQSETCSQMEATNEGIKESVTKADTETASSNKTQNILTTDIKTQPTEDQKPTTKESLKTSESNSDDVVTTTDTLKLQQTPVQSVEKCEDKREDNSDADGRSTPDSTINSNEVIQNRLSQESVPDSTNEVQNDPNSIVSSTHDPQETKNKDTVESSAANKDATTSLDSIGSILDILKNKSKIKQLLSLLGDQGNESEKIKKKLEKLSEIVSDEEEEVTTDKDSAAVKGNESIKDTKEENSNELIEDTKNENEKESKEDTNKEQGCGSKDDVKNKVEITSDITTSSKNEMTITKEEHDIDSSNKTKSETVLGTTEIENNAPTKAESNKNKVESNEITTQHKKVTKKIVRRRRGRGGKFKKCNQNTEKRVTRSNLNSPKKPIKKKQSRELVKLQNDINEMFMKDEILNATGIRMCRLAKLGDGKKDKIEPVGTSAAPLVVIEKDKGIEALEETLLTNKLGKKQVKPKALTKPKGSSEVEKKSPKPKVPKYKPGPKSKTKPSQKQEDDPYEFESDSASDMTTDEPNVKSIDEKDESSGSESESLASFKSLGSTEVLSDLKKKPTRKRAGWKSGVIKARNNKRKKIEAKSSDTDVSDVTPIPKAAVTIPDLNCFTDKSYCFRKVITAYPCRLCDYFGEDIVAHYKENHPHSEIPLSRMDPVVAKEAIEQCEDVNFQAICNVPTDKYVCRFCFKVFWRKKRNILEAFFWHIVSMHTGEYKKICSECVNVTTCPLNLDIPPPPKDREGQLIGYICEKCNFTQISLENLKTHVIVRHNDEQTEVYTINLAVMSKKTIGTILKQSLDLKPRVLRSTRSNQSVAEMSDDHSDVTGSEPTSETPVEQNKQVMKNESPLPPKASEPTPYHTKITYENDDSHSDASHVRIDTTRIKEEIVEDSKEEPVVKQELPQPELEPAPCDDAPPPEEAPAPSASDDIFDYPHFKISYTNAGLKEYVCCINGTENHYKTTLLISMKKHVQTKHTESWDGYCSICKVIVTTQGQHNFKECLQHCLDSHMDNFPVLEKVPEVEKTPEKPAVVKPYINVRPLSELISTDAPVSPKAPEAPILPKIESIVSLGVPAAERAVSPSYPPAAPEPDASACKYEEVQAEVMARKHQVVRDSMLDPKKLINVFKCAGRYCSFTSDSVEDALLHASTHTRVGGEGSLGCAYCSFDCGGNAIDLVMHAFKVHGACAFACAYCLYRAAAAQLVVAHAARAHAALPPRVLAATQPPPAAPPEHAMLPREVAVLYYVCPHNCKYRTYTAQKFCEHLAQRHPQESWHTCYLCSKSIHTSAELIQHMKSHSLNVYQCTWCRHGADSEPGLLAHAAAAHPARQPQAYLRLITSRDGTKEFRVLPLASFNKAKVSVHKVEPSINKDDPVRDAERSIELENLIGRIGQVSTQPMETVTASTAAESPEKDAAAPIEPLSQPDDDIPTVVDRPPTLTDEERTRAPTPILKSEPVDPEPSKAHNIRTDIIYCLDSDEDEPKNDAAQPETPQNVIDLSDEEMQAEPGKTDQAEPKFEKLPLDKVLKCPSCFGLFKNVGGFKKHTQSCLGSVSVPLSCAHCNLVTKNRDELIYHYTLDHLTSDTGLCGICGAKFYSVGTTRKHLKDVHKVSKVVVSSKSVEFGKLVYTVSPMAPAKLKVQKRKSSSSVQEPPAKMKKYGPEDVNKLPINPILDELVHCALCEFNTKVRLNMVRHLQFHSAQQPVPHSAPVNPVPHLASNEMHFDRMVNLASSSAATRPQPALASQLPRDQAQRYPRLVSPRQRCACGARDCSYISANEDLFRCHWNTLHSGSDQFVCVHCGQNVPLETGKSAFNAILEHLQMHDSTLFACPTCSFHHYKREVVAKHGEDAHGTAGVVVVREEVDASAVPRPAAGTPAAPTMDLKPWQCGLCEFRSMLRPDVIEHCGRTHQSKMQYKCANCPFRTSTLENVTKHMSNSHPGRSHEVFYYFYREGTVPSEDGVPKWVKQRQKLGLPEMTEIKTEVPESMTLAQLLNTPRKAIVPPATPSEATSTPVDLNIVKKEMELDPPGPVTTEQLCQKYGQFCEPNGLNYKCPLCQVVVEDTREAMQSHLFEELGYRRWECGTCSYKAFHSAGLNEHIISEHRGQNQSPVQLPSDPLIEAWVSALLDHQTTAITKHKESLAKQKIMTERPARPQKPEETPKADTKAKFTMAELEKAFGPLGMPSNMSYCCPKCNIKIKDENAMRNHLESELTKIRWCCSVCMGTFQTYHAAQFHCKSAHAAAQPPARPREAQRDPAARAAWPAAVLQVQKLSMRCLPLSGEPEPPAAADAADAAEPDDNSLLVVRYEERVPTPEEAMLRRRPPAAAAAPAPAPAPAPGPAPAPAPSPAALASSGYSDNDDDRLIIDELAVPSGSTSPPYECPYCVLRIQHGTAMVDHLYEHFNLRPYACTLCEFTGHRPDLRRHAEWHGRVAALFRRVRAPPEMPSLGDLLRRQAPLVCLVCERGFGDAESATHRHADAEGRAEMFVRSGGVVLECGACLALWPDVAQLRRHADAAHVAHPARGAFRAVPAEPGEPATCGACGRRCVSLRQLRSHAKADHGGAPAVVAAPGEVAGAAPAPRRAARKSTTRLPRQAVARKSTARPAAAAGFSFYGSRPPPLHAYRNVTTLMSFCNTDVTFTMDKLSEVLKIDPRVVVRDVSRDPPSTK